MLLTVNDAEPVGQTVTSPALIAVLTTTGHTHVGRALVNVRDVDRGAGREILPGSRRRSRSPPSRCRRRPWSCSCVTVAVPVTPASPLVTGGTSFAGDSVAVKSGWSAPGSAVVLDDELPQPTASERERNGKNGQTFHRATLLRDDQ